MLKKLTLEDGLIYLVLAVGSAIAIGQFIYNRSLWLDEAMLALNILHFGPAGLLQPLDFYIVAPILFLQIEKIFSWVIPNSELGLRFLPLLAFLMSLYIFYKIAAAQHSNKYVLILCVSLFAFNSPLLYYASEVKQYMTDVLMSTALCYLLLRNYPTPQKKFIYLTVGGVVAIFLSNVSVIVLFSAGMHLLYVHVVLEKKYLKYVVITGTAWASTFAFYYYFFIYHHPSTGPMIAYWSPLGVFAPQNPFNKEFYYFQADKWMMISNHLFQFGRSGSAFLSVLFGLGIISLIARKNVAMLLITVLPIVLHLALSSFKLYPFDVRLLLYTTPLFILIFSFGFKEVVDFFFQDLKIERFRLLALFIPIWLSSSLFAHGFYAWRLPFKREEVKKNLNYINNHREPNDGMYVYSAAQHHFSYYRETGKFSIANELVKISVTTSDYDQYVQEIRTLKGRQWLLFSHAGPDEQYIVDHLDSIGYQKITEYKDVGANAYLYDLR